MSYNLTFQCSCVVHVSLDPQTPSARTRVIESRGSGCLVSRHKVGLRLYLWELLPDPEHHARPRWETRASA